ncbi:GbpC/Spa domain-containing protein, partial [Streptococcus orisratti]|uniref:GbpC/Spa domain-containing protein n=1 Tax=Streptococcus orisratti TaxID=114652 RepID=UPI0023F9D918
MKKKHYHVLGLSLFSSLLLATPNALADETSVTPPSLNSTETTNTTNLTNNKQLNESLSAANSEGIVILEESSETFETEQAVQNDYAQQTQIVNDVTKDYQEAKEDYQQSEQAYQNYQKNLEIYGKEQNNYQNYLSEEKRYQTERETYQKELVTYQKTLSDNQQLNQNYQSALQQYKQEEKLYQNNLSQYNNQVTLNQEKSKRYQEELAAYEKALKDYETAKTQFDAAVAENNRLQSIYTEKLRVYQQNHKEWELEKALYNEKLKEAEKNTKKDGYLSQVYAQYLIFRSEPNATVNFEGVSDFFDSNHDFGTTLSGIGGNPDTIITSNVPYLAKGVGGATAAGAADGYGLILKKNQPITVTYTGLEKSSYRGRPITKVVYTFELLSTFSNNDIATAFIYKDPTRTIYIGNYGDNKGLTDFTIHQTIRYYYNDGEQVELDENSTSLLSLSSLNNSFEFGEQEYVKLSDSMEFIPITGSSVSSNGSIVASFGSNNSKADGSKFERSEWDNDGSDNEYFGAGVAKIIGSSVSFDFGIRYSQDDIRHSSNPRQLRNGSRLWFAVNSDLKASGILDTQLKDEPKAPEKPNLNTSAKEPNRPSKPQQPVLSTLEKPLAPIKPSEPIYHPLPKKPLVPKAPQKVNKPLKPKEVVKPTPPDIPVIFYHKAVFRPVVKPLTPKKNQLTRDSQAVTKVTVYYLPVISTFIRSTPHQPVYSPSISTGTVTQNPTKTNRTSKVQSQTKPNKKSSQKKKSSSNKDDKKKRKSLFSKNTGLKDEDEKIFHQFTKDLEKKAKEKYSWAKFFPSLYQNLVDGYVFQGIAQGGRYEQSFLQQLFINFSKISKSKNTTTALQRIDSQHRDSNNYPDLAHSGATLATSIPTGFRSFITKGLLSTVPYPNEKLNSFTMSKNLTISGMLNSFFGDIITTMGKDDVLANMDSLILTKHPDYRKLPAHERLKKYYSQTDLSKKRKKLFLETYSKDKSTAKLKFLASLTLSSITTGGLLALAYSKLSKQTNSKKLKENINKIDDNILEGSLKKFIKSPVSSTLKYAKSMGGKLVNKVKKGWNSITNKISNLFGKDKTEKATKGKATSSKKATPKKVAPRKVAPRKVAPR